ncbi:MAG: hypothetical protein RMI78_01095 [Nitrososphaerota archaeon]|nr:hypothetical protein [Nitrososphaerota archaeon]
MLGDDNDSSSFRAVFRSLFQQVIGETGVRVLEYHFRRLSSSDMYSLLSEDPGEFYRVLTRFFGAGAKAFLRIIASELVTRYELDDISVDELMGILTGERAGSRKKLVELIARIRSKGGES